MQRHVTPAITGNPQFKSAQQACSKLLPGGGPGSGPNRQISPQEQSQYLKAAACIRSHGIPTFPTRRSPPAACTLHIKG
jgi:hypothetical protein